MSTIMRNLNPAERLVIKLVPYNRIPCLTRIKYLFKYWRKYPTFKKQKEIKESLIEAIENFSSFVNEISQKYIKKDHSADLEYLLGAILKDERTLKNETDKRNFCKISLTVANKYLQEAVTQIKNHSGNLKDKNVYKHCEIIRDYLHDIKPFVEYFMHKDEPGFVLINGGKSYENYSYEMNRIANNLYWNSLYRSNIMDQKMSINLSNFALRQALELKFKRILGIYDVYTKNLDGPKLRHDFFPEFINNNASHFTIPYDHLAFLINVYKWTNRTIHIGENPRIWELRLALDYLAPFFKWGEGISITGKVTTSINGAIKINN